MQFNLDETRRQSSYIREGNFCDLGATAAKGSIDFTFLNSGFGLRQIVSTTSLWQQCLSVHTSNPAGEGFSFPWVEAVNELTRVKHSLWLNGIYVTPKHKCMPLHILVRPPSQTCTQSDMHTLVLTHIYMYVHN